MIQNTPLVIKNTLFVNQTNQNTLFYGIFDDSWKNHNIHAWRSWSWVSSKWENIKRNVEHYGCYIVTLLSLIWSKLNWQNSSAGTSWARRESFLLSFAFSLWTRMYATREGTQSESFEDENNFKTSENQQRLSTGFLLSVYREGTQSESFEGWKKSFDKVQVFWIHVRKQRRDSIKFFWRLQTAFLMLQKVPNWLPKYLIQHELSKDMRYHRMNFFFNPDKPLIRNQ